MKVKTLSALAGLGGALILSGAAQAAYTGISFEHSNAFFNSHPNAGVKADWLANGGDRVILRLYANFNSNTTADRVNAVAGNSASPLNVNVVGGTFHNFVDGYGNHYNLPAVAPAGRGWETWVTINSLPSGSGVSLSPGFGTETGNFTGSSASSTNVAWFITPDNTQGQAVATAAGQAPAPAGTFRVLLGQFTIDPDAPFHGITFSGLVNVNGQDMLNQQASWFVPAPGALALLGLAGLVGSRRRRG